MSYILDALKKAEREREHTRVPTLMSEHVATFGAMHRLRRWVAGGALLLGGGLAIWLWLSASGPASLPASGVPARSEAPAARPEERQPAPVLPQPVAPTVPPAAAAPRSPDLDLPAPRATLRPPRREQPAPPSVVVA